jgi:DNA-binding NarL/FixJ family response regulator
VRNPAVGERDILVRPIRVLIVDDDPLVRAGLVMMLGGTDQVEVAGEASDGSEVLSAVDHHRPDVVLLDLRMPKVDGLAAMALLRAQPSPPRILVLTTFDADDQVLRALRAGAAGFLVKDTPPADIVRAIELVAAGESMLSPTVTRRLIERLAGEADSDAQQRQAVQRLASLSERDREIARGIGAGRPNAAIAAELHLSVATIKSHVSSMLAELGFENRVQIALMVQDAERGAAD